MGLVRQNLASVLKRLGEGKYVIVVNETRFGGAEKIELEAKFMSSVEIAEFLEIMQQMEGNEVEGMKRLVEWLFDYLYKSNSWSGSVGIDEKQYKEAFRSFIASHITTIVQEVIKYNMPESQEYSEIQSMVDELKKRKQGGK